MIDQIVFISFDHSFRPYPSEAQIRELFEKFGEITTVISQRQFKYYFLLWFEDKEGASECKKNQLELYNQHGYLIERFENDDQDEAVTFEETIGVADENCPSLMNLNEDCLIHILSYLANSSPVEYSCARLRRICRYRWRKVHTVRSTNIYPCMDRIFLYGPTIHHLSLSFPGDLFLNLTLERLVRCNNLKTFYLREISINRQVYHLMKHIFAPLKELMMDLHYSPDQLSKLIACAPKLEKISLIFRYTPDFERSGQLLVSSRTAEPSRRPKSLSYCNATLLKEFSNLTFLTVLIMPLEIVAIGPLLTALPGLRVLSCIPIQSMMCVLPNPHGLRDFFANNIDDYDLEVVINVRRVCPDLRHLRISGSFSIKHLSLLKRELLPLEGLHLSHVDIFDISDFLSSFAHELKLLFIENCSVPKAVFPFVLSNFTKLEVLSWDEEIHGNFGDFLAARTSQTPLTVVSRNAPTDEHKTLLPSLKWERSRDRLFGHFSIYSFSVLP